MVDGRKNNTNECEFEFDRYQEKYFVDLPLCFHANEGEGYLDHVEPF